MNQTREIPLDVVIDAASDVAIFATDSSGLTTLFNTGAERIFGIPRSQAIGKQFPVAFIPISRVNSWRKVSELPADAFHTYSPASLVDACGEAGSELRWAFRRQDQELVAVSININPVQQTSGSLVGYVFVARDVSEQIAALEALERGEALKSAILEASLDAVIHMDHEGRIIEFNPAAERIFGFTRAKTIGVELVSLIIPQRYREAHTRGMKRFLETGEGPVLGQRIEIFGLRSDGSEIPVELEVAVVKNQSPPVFSAFVRDISDRRKAEAELRDREARLSSIVESAVDGIIVIDSDGIVESYNRGAEKIFGYSATEIIGQNVRMIMEPRDAVLHDERIQRYLTTGVRRIMGQAREVTARHSNGSPIDIELSISEMTISGEKRFTGICRDVTTRNRNREALAVTNSLLETIRKVQLQFISHDTQEIIFDSLLQSALKLTLSPDGYLGEVVNHSEGKVQLRSRASTGLVWGEGAGQFGTKISPRKFEFSATEHSVALSTTTNNRSLAGLFEQLIRYEQPIVVNEPLDSEINLGLPAGHPPIFCFLGLPIHLGKQLIGVLGLVNRPGGYLPEMIQFLQPLLGTLATIIQADRDERRRTQAERELQEAKQAAEEASRAKSEFLANMSHEVRTPMAAVLGFSEILLNHGISPAERDKAIQSIRLNGQHLMQLIDDILDLTKIEANKLVIEQIPYSPWQIVQEVQSLLRVRASERGVSMTALAIGRVPKTVQLDPTRVRQILVNFVSNAIKFTPTGGQIQIRYWCDSPELHHPRICLSVEDTGIGIPEDKLKTLFQQFHQADMSTTRRFGGTGLGLNISQKLATAMKGEVRVSSEFGRGSEFTLRIPIGMPQLYAEWINGSTLDSVFAQKSVPTSDPGFRMQGSVLLAEDNPDIQEVVVAHLKSAGLDVDVAGDGVTVVEKAQAGGFDVILMDMQMPKLDGYGATSSLRQGGYRGPIIALTAHAFAEDRARCLRVGCTEHLSKPVTRELLLETIAFYLNKSKQSSDLKSHASEDETIGSETQELNHRTKHAKKDSDTEYEIPVVSDSSISADIAASSDENTASGTDPNPDSRSAKVDQPLPSTSQSAPPGLNSLVAQFVGRLPERLQEVEAAYDNRDFVKLKSLAHRAKGVGGMYGFPEMSAAGGELESALRKEADEATIARLVHGYLAVCRQIIRRHARGTES